MSDRRRGVEQLARPGTSYKLLFTQSNPQHRQESSSSHPLESHLSSHHPGFFASRKEQATPHRQEGVNDLRKALTTSNEASVTTFDGPPATNLEPAYKTGVNHSAY